MTEGEAIYDRIVSKIKEKSLNRLDLCQYANISSQAITNLKKQNSIPRADTAIKIAAYLNVSVEYLITGKESGLTN
jgi:transcriptional regulator with XRE-family HTH domain